MLSGLETQGARTVGGICEYGDARDPYVVLVWLIWMNGFLQDLLSR